MALLLAVFAAAEVAAVRVLQGGPSHGGVVDSAMVQLNSLLYEDHEMKTPSKLHSGLNNVFGFDVYEMDAGTIVLIVLLVIVMIIVCICFCCCCCACCMSAAIL